MVCEIYVDKAAKKQKELPTPDCLKAHHLISFPSGLSITLLGFLLEMVTLNMMEGCPLWGDEGRATQRLTPVFSILPHPVTGHECPCPGPISSH